ncbi:MAG: DUF1015 family protein [Sandaracinaceae bacterium]|nr:DUF1015 family protein [Sandaracinaceae bacterium]
MVAIAGLVGLRPHVDHVASFTAPPYDVIKEGTPLWSRLFANPRSLVHVTLGADPKQAFERLRAEVLVADDEPGLFVYEQRTEGGELRTGLFAAVEVSDYSERKIIRHEKTFDEKVKGRIALAQATGHTIGPVFLLTRAAIDEALERAKQSAPLYDFTSDFGGGTDLHAIHSRVWKVPAASALGGELASLIAPEPLYIADGHHRYHAALKNGQSHVLAYITRSARIQAYDRVVNGTIPFERASSSLPLEPAERFDTPPKHAFRIYSKQGCFTLRARSVPSDVVGRLDCSILERELYPHLGLTHAQIVDPAHFDYYPESMLDDMKAVVDAGKYEIAVALHPVSIDELMAVADAGLSDASIVMPEKSTFFSPKILSGLFLYRHSHGPSGR